MPCLTCKRGRERESLAFSVSPGVSLRQRKALLKLSRKNNVVFLSVGCRIHGISKKEKLTLWLGWLLAQVSVRAHAQLAGSIPGGRVCRGPGRPQLPPLTLMFLPPSTPSSLSLKKEKYICSLEFNHLPNLTPIRSFYQ